MSKRIVFVCMSLLLSQVLFAMQPTEQIKTFSPKKIVLNLVGTHYLLDHETICSFAETNKAYHQLMLVTAKDRKNRLKVKRYIDCPFGKLVHKYGSACYCVYKRVRKNQLVLSYSEIYNDTIVTKEKRFNRFISLLPHEPKPFFNEKESFCFYGYGVITSVYKNCSESSDSSFDMNSFDREAVGILEYNFDGSVRLCNVLKEDKLCCLSFCLSYPFLCKAFLDGNATNDTLVQDDVYHTPIKMYSLDNVVIPSNYKERVEWKIMQGAPFTKLLFEDFPEYIKDAIEKRYQECQNKKELK